MSEPDAPAHLVARNGAILARRWPAVWQAIQAAPLPDAFHWSESPVPTLVVDGLHMSSGYDREGEARTQARLVPESSPSACVYGPGMGELPRALLRRRALQRLEVVLMNPGVFLAVLAAADQTDWLADPRTRLSLASPESTLKTPFAASPPCLALAEEAARPLRDRVMLELATPYTNARAGMDELVPRRLEENRALLATDGDVASLFGSQPGATVVVVGGGPTLTDQLERLKALGGRYPLIAVDAAFRPLCEAGIPPDVVVAIDAGPGVAQFFDVPAPAMADTTLVYFPVVQHETLSRWAGRRLAAYPDRPVYRALATSLPRGMLYSSGSVIHPAIDLAVQMGARRVLLVGADFSYPLGLSHAAGTAWSRAVEVGPTTPDVINGHGQRVPSSAGLIGFYRDLETYVRAHPEVSFLNASRAGAAIAGTTYWEGEGPDA